LTDFEVPGQIGDDRMGLFPHGRWRRLYNFAFADIIAG
jgi:hypothetical protein